MHFGTKNQSRDNKWYSTSKNEFNRMHIFCAKANCLDILMMKFVYFFVKKWFMQQPMTQRKQKILDYHAKHHLPNNSLPIRQILNFK
ncbi:UNKNOWN [Stylonychia lemnae]|uniref:Uncharacterized protein n=1 Tax=Stylonychia lemnae TaxID=5949 RepID=A0A078AT74_STYLE|nr:UNKNOWN [Stylonychia lemnae]|eukprot:CDW85226.1 UNKNOWN [Stylonychia lemnae]